MQPIDPAQLALVTGGAGGALLGGLLQSAGPILNGVASIIGAAKSGGGAQAAAPAQPAPEAAPSAAPSTGGANPLVSISVSMNGQRIA